MSGARRLSYVLFALLIVAAACLHMGTLLLTTLFGVLTLETFCFKQRKRLSLAIYLVLVVVLGSGLVSFSALAVHTLPKIAETSIPAMVSFAQKNGIELPFTDFDSLKDAALDMARSGAASLGNFAKIASFQFVQLLAGLVMAASIFFHPHWTTEISPVPNLYSSLTGELEARFRLLAESFAKVIRAQLTISAINTLLTTIFLLSFGYPYILLLLVLVFLCGMLPVVGNLLSNCIIVGVGFTISPHMGLIALVFLIVIHKLEYFLNSKIVGRQIQTPMWLTLVGLIVGERLMGIAGMVLAPVFLYYIRVEMSGYAAPIAVESAE